jgi:flavin-dependent dehydrogenase
VKSVEVDYLVLGAGLAGLVLRRALHPSVDAVVVDPHPGSWKIGEANVPEMFASPALAEVLDDAKRLPSASAKNGSMFVGEDSLAVYPIVSNAFAALHVARDELEQLLLDRWRIPVARERVVRVDVGARVVATEATTYRVRRQIIDCSGGAMLVAEALGETRPLWPIHSTWRYLDVTAVDREAFWRDAAARGRRPLFIDIPNVRLLDMEPAAFAPEQATNLTKVRDGVWLWQIPLFGARRLSVGLVSRHGEVASAELDDAIALHGAACYKLAPRPPGEGIYDRVHRRSGFARRALRAATMDYILVGDAFMFVDPVYSVGTALAVNKALEVSAALNRGPWTPAARDAYVARYESLLARRVEAFASWYDEATRQAAPGAAALAARFPAMRPFHASITHEYARVVEGTLTLTREANEARDGR